MMQASELLTTQGGDVCPACGALAIAQIDLGGYRLFECTICGSWSSDALIRKASTSFVPENYFKNAEVDLDKWDGLWSRLQWSQGCTRTVLDVGCGTGAYLAYLQKWLGGDSRLEGIELEPERAAEARQRNPGARVYEGDARATLSQVGRPFDLITLWDVFEHVESPGELLKELGRVLSGDGLIYIQTIHEHSILPTLGRWIYRFSGGRFSYPASRTHEAHHLVFFTRAGLDVLANQAGLRIRDLWFDRLSRSRMDGNVVLTVVSSLFLALENAFGNGLFINLILERDPDRRSATSG